MKTKLLLYCTKAKPYIQPYLSIAGVGIIAEPIKPNYINGKIVAECEVECEKINTLLDGALCMTYFASESENKLLQKSCLTYEQLHNYLKGKNGFSLHLTNIKVFEKPFRIEYVKDIEMNALKKAPQNMQKVWFNGCWYVLISIRPKWLCKILNGEKTIEVRRKILKEVYDHANKK